MRKLEHLFQWKPKFTSVYVCVVHKWTFKSPAIIKLGRYLQALLLETPGVYYPCV